MRSDNTTLEEELLLYAVTDRSWLLNQTLYEQVELALKGGATFLQLREKNLCDSEFLLEAKAIQELCREYKVPFIINDNVKVALETDADGIHVGQHDMEAGDVRKLLGEDKILGVSAQTVEQAVLAEQRGADYLGVGAVFPTGSKDDADDVSFETLTKDNIKELKGSGICGAAVISAIFAQKDIRGATEELKKAVAAAVE